MAAVDEFDLTETGGDTRDSEPPRARTTITTAVRLAPRGDLGRGRRCARRRRRGVGRTAADGHRSGLDVGLLDLPLHVEPELVWQNDLVGGQVVHTIGDRALVVADDDIGIDRTLVGVDLSNGEDVWRFDDDDYTCQWGGPRMLCVTDPGEAEAQIVTIAVDDGRREVSDRPFAVAATGVDGGMVLVEAVGDRDYEIALIDADGTARWRAEIEIGNTIGDRPLVSLRVADGAVWLDGMGVGIARLRPRRRGPPLVSEARAPAGHHQGLR